MNWILINLFIFLVTFISFSQKKKIGKFSDQLQEVSGLTFLNDSILISHNDSGGKAVLYLLNLKGQIIHEVVISNANNIDWEDITNDHEGSIYIADIGNNKNKRTDLCIYKIKSENLLIKDSINAEKIEFSYPEQKAFPPQKEELNFDAEALIYYGDSLFVFTKCRTEPFTGKTICYAIPRIPGKYQATKKCEIVIGTRGWWKDSITAADFHEGKCYLLTYNRIIIFQFESNNLLFKEEKKMGLITQKEAIAINSKGQIYLGEEHQKFIGKGNLYKVKWKENQ